MELGNIIFGNSRGQYSVPRTNEWESQIFRLFNAMDPVEDGSYGIDFENKTFSIMPYYWGDCTCGYDEKENEWSENNDHADGCYQKDYEKIRHYESLYENHGRFLKEKLKPLYEKHGFETKSKNWWYGCAIRCDCDYDVRWAKFQAENSHSKDCPIIRPNFAYKPTGFELQWYKYPLRDSYMNQNITIKQFAEIIDACILSLKGL